MNSIRSRMQTQRDSSVIIRTGLVAAMSGLVTAAGFASEDALKARFVPGPATYDTSIGTALYVIAVSALAALYLAVALEVRRRPRARGFSAALIGASLAAVVFFGWLSVLGAQFFWAADPSDSTREPITFGLLSFAAYAGPAVASLVAALLTRFTASRRLSVFLGPLAVLAVTTTAVTVLAVHQRVS